MKLNELSRNLNIWTSNEERKLMSEILEPRPLDTFTERDQTIIETLVRKNLLIKVKGQHTVYVYPNI